MPDHATSRDARVQEQLDRLWALSPGADVLGLERITKLLTRLGDPHLALPPVFHVAGTNGKGSTCAYLRAAIEATGLRAHVYASPHLCRFNERIRLAGRLIDDAALATLLAEVLDQASGIGASFFEVTTAAAFLAFARTPADACIVEVGLGGRLDATNVIPRPAVTGIAALGLDHQAFLGDSLVDIAGEKAGIAKPGVPLVTMAYDQPLEARIAEIAGTAGASLVRQGRDWTIAGDMTPLYQDVRGQLRTSAPAMVGAHQFDNLGLAIAMLRHQSAIHVPDEAITAAPARAIWPARLQRLSPGPLRDRLASGSRVWLDGAHNPSAAQAIAPAFVAASAHQRTLIVGLLANKDANGVIAALLPGMERVVAIPVEGHAHHSPDTIVAIARRACVEATTAPDITTALGQVADRPRDVLIAGSLYLAGTVLTANEEEPE